MSMDPERPDVQEASEILDECAALPHADRAAFLTGRCAGRDALRREVESLLGYLHDPEFEDGDPKDDEMARARRRMGSEIGGCRLLELLAIGGMGAVYRAEQESPRREVALKLLRPDGLGTDAWRRLNREALALGRLDHPAIARVFTAGIHRDAHGATPFLTMELVEGGRPISRWWRETALPIAARLELFANVCEAIHHGHIKGVLHRDVKPGNLLVDRDDRPKVIDFGIARVIEPGTDDSTAPVTGGRVIGTILYMAPERLEGDGQVDVRSDVYGLGVVLYELLAGRLPFGEWGGSLAATAAAVVRGEAPPPSSFDRRFRGDLDAIVAKAMALDPADRYDSASALAADLRAHLRDEPIRADRGGRIVQARKFLRRNRIGVAAVLGIVVALAIGLAVSLRSTARAERALYLALLAQGDLTVARNDVGSTLRILQSLGPDREEEWPVRMLRRATDDTVDSAMFGEWNLFRGRLDADRRRLLASGWGERPELVVLGTSPVAVVDRIPLPSTGMGADWGPRRVDGPETVIAGLDDGRVVEVQVTDGAIRREIATIAPEDKPTTSGQISDVALAPCGRRLAIGHSSDSVRLVDLVDGSILDVDGFADPVSPNWVFVDWSPDGESLAVAATGGTFLVDAATGSMRKLSGRAANQAAFSPDGARIASALSVGATEMIDVATGTADIIVEALWPIWGVDWSPDGKHIAMVGRSHWIILFDVAARSRRMFKSEANPVWTARWTTPTEVMTLPLGHEFSLQAPYQRISSIRRTIGDLDRWELRLRFADGGRSLVCTVPGGRIERIDPLIETRTVIATVPIDQPSTDATPDGATIVVADALEPGPLWVVETGDGSARRIDGEFLGPVAISPDLQRVVAVGPKGEATVIDLGSGAVEARFDRPTFTKTVSFAWIGPEAVAWCQPNGASRLFRGGDGGWSLHHDPDASLLEAWSRDHAWYWTDLSLRVVRSGSDRLGDHTAPESLRGLGIVLCMAAHPTLPLVAFGTSDGRIAIYDESIDTIVANYQVVARRITDIAWSPDGSMLAGIDLGGGIRFIDSEPLSSRWPEIKRRRAEAETGGLPFGRPGP